MMGARLAARRPSSPLVLALAAVGPVVVVFVLIPLRETLSGASLAMVVALVVVAIAAMGRRTAAYLAGAVGALAFDFFLTQPFGSFEIYHDDNLVAAVCLLLLGVVVGEVARRSRLRAIDVLRRDEDFGRVYYAADLAARDEPMAVLVDTVGRELTDLLGLEAWLWDEAPEAGEEVPEITRDGRLTVGLLEWPSATAGLPRGARLLVIHDGTPVGAFVLEPTTGRPITRRELLVAVSLADQVGAAFDDAGAGRRWTDDR